MTIISIYRGCCATMGWSIAVYGQVPAILHNFGDNALYFEENRGQPDSQASDVAQDGDFVLSLMRTGSKFSTLADVIEMRLPRYHRAMSRQQ